MGICILLRTASATELHVDDSVGGEGVIKDSPSKDMRVDT